MKRRGGFTLIELLVVVAIIGLLIAILVPSLGKVRKRARAAVCATNERGLVNSYRMYVQETKMILSSTGHNDSGAWDYQLLAQGANPNSNLSPATYYNKNGLGGAMDKIRFCPETNSERRGAPGPLGTSIGSATLAWDCHWGPGGGSTGGYAMNNWLYNESSMRNSRNSGMMLSSWFYPLLRLGDETSVPVFVDAAWHDVLIRDNDSQVFDSTNPETGPTRNIADILLDRHNRAVNVSFWDGHVETVKLPDLWTVKWYKGWTKSTPGVVHLK